MTYVLPILVRVRMVVIGVPVIDVVFLATPIGLHVRACYWCANAIGRHTVTYVVPVLSSYIVLHPIFSRLPAKRMDASVDASTCASGNHACRG